MRLFLDLTIHSSCLLLLLVWCNNASSFFLQPLYSKPPSTCSSYSLSSSPFSSSSSPSSLCRLQQQQSSQEDDVDVDSVSTSVNFAMDPTSSEARDIVMNHLGLSLTQYKQLAALAVLVNDWNTRINLISRKDCSKEVVFGRHILPSLAPLALYNNHKKDIFEKEGEGEPCKKIVDVGTGGGFPGLPLAIAFPDVEFLLVDSVGKKLAAVEDMAQQLGLTNVKVHHGRAELLKGEYDICVGRSVAAIPTYCYWIQNLLKKKNGHLMYLIGGDIEQHLLDQAVADEDIDDLLNCDGVSDKRVLVFSQSSVKKIAATSGEKVRVPTKQKISLGGTKKQPQQKRARGQWEKEIIASQSNVDMRASKDTTI